MWGQATKIALINMQTAIANTKEGQAQIAELEKKYGPKQQEFQKRAADIQSKQDLLNKTKNTISDQALAAQTAEITRLKTALQRDNDDTSADSDQDEQKMMQDLGGKMIQVITKYSQDNQIMIVFDISSQPNNLICCASAPDITKEVIALYDKTNPGGAAAPAPASKPAASTPAPRPAGTTTAPAPKPAGAATPAK